MNRHRHAIEQVSRRWRRGRRGDSGERAVNLISTQVVAALQRWRLLLSPEQHQRHHRTHDSDFCIVTGHTDPIVNWVYGTALRRLWPFAAVSREEERRFDQALDAVYGAIY